MPNYFRVKQYRPSGPIKVVRSVDSSSNSSFRDIYKGEHFSILQERELFFDRRNGVQGSSDRNVYSLAGIYTYPDVAIAILLNQNVR